MIKVCKTKWPAIALILGCWAALRISVEADDILAMGAGTLTGPLSTAALNGSVILFAGAVIQFWHRRTGLGASCAGFVLTLPLFSWQLGPGAWCSALGDCESTYALLRFDSCSAVSLAMALLSIGIQVRAPRL